MIALQRPGIVTGDNRTSILLLHKDWNPGMLAPDGSWASAIIPSEGPERDWWMFATEDQIGARASDINLLDIEGSIGTIGRVVAKFLREESDAVVV